MSTFVISVPAGFNRRGRPVQLPHGFTVTVRDCRNLSEARAKANRMVREYTGGQVREILARRPREYPE